MYSVLRRPSQPQQYKLYYRGCSTHTRSFDTDIERATRAVSIYEWRDCV
jgi:hypothetical protein